MNKEAIKRQVSAAFSNFKTAINGHEAINTKRADGGWSVGEIGGHLVKSTQLQLGSTAKADRAYDAHAEDIKALFLNFEMKFPAMPQLHPDAKTYTKEGLFLELDKNLSDILLMIETEDLAVLCPDIELPVWGALTKYEWMVLLENHMIRHTWQVRHFNSVTA